MKLSKELTFDMAHKLEDYHGRCSNCHGHRFYVKIEVEGKVGSDGILVDFNHLEKLIDEEFDHKTLFQDTENNKKLAGLLPGLQLVSYNPTSENIVEKIYKLVKAMLNAYNFEHVKITLKESPTSEVVYEGV